MERPQPRLIVFSSLFPHSGAPQAGLFVRERMFRVAKELPITVVSPQPWFPGQSVLRLFRPHFRPPAPTQESQNEVEIYCPRFLSVPGLFKQFDGYFMALGSFFTLRRLKKRLGYNLLDAHFGYPDGLAATLLGRWLDLPVCITLRGTEVRHSQDRKLRPLLKRALTRATWVFSVSDSLRRLALALGAAPDKLQVVGNGVDTLRFHRVEKSKARARYRLPLDAQVIISVGALVERKGFHRVIEILPELLHASPKLHFLIVGGAGPEGGMRKALEHQVATLGLTERVHFLGTIPSEELKWPLSAADLFVLATSNEGWANVILEAMACGLPVITTDVGGNAEVVNQPGLGTIVPFGDGPALRAALNSGLSRHWDRTAIRAYAEDNSWDTRVERLAEAFQAIVAQVDRQAGMAPVINESD